MAAQALPVPLQGLLYLGVRNEHVRRLQTRLNERAGIGGGGTLAPDGAFGAKTDARVRGFQKACQLKVDGIVGIKTSMLLGFTYTQGNWPPPVVLKSAPRPSKVPGPPPPIPQPSLENGPLGMLAELIANHILAAVYETVNVFQKAASIVGDDIVPLTRRIIQSAQGISAQIKDAMLRELRSGSQAIGKNLAQIIRNAQAAARAAVDGFLNGVSNVGMTLFAIVKAVGSRVRAMFDVVFDKAVSVASGVGGSVAEYGRTVMSAIYTTLSSVIDTARSLT